MSEDRIKKIEEESAAIRKQILKLEFQHKKDIAEADKRFNEWAERMEKGFEKMQKNFTYINKLAGITFEKFDDIESRLEGA